MAAKNIKDEKDGDTRKKPELSAWVTGLLTTPVIVMREAGLGRGRSA